MTISSKFIFFIGFLLVSFSNLIGQELNLDVTINTPKLNTADPAVFQTLETAIREFYNNTVWTSDEFLPHERIEGSFQINIKEDISSSTFLADFYISVSRPVFGSNYYSQTFLHIDPNITFGYEQSDPLFNNKSAYTDNLSSILTFYAYVILGIDYDTFSPMGGDTYYKIAQNISSNVPPTVSDPAWKSINNSRNRYWLIENTLNARAKPYRQAIYDYHRRSLDMMSEDPDRSRAVMLSALKAIGDVNNQMPNSMILQIFSNTKRDELLEVFEIASKGDKDKVYNIMAAIDPSKSKDFNDLRKSK